MPGRHTRAWRACLAAACSRDNAHAASLGLFPGDAFLSKMTFAAVGLIRLENWSLRTCFRGLRFSRKSSTSWERYSACLFCLCNSTKHTFMILSSTSSALSSSRFSLGVPFLSGVQSDSGALLSAQSTDSFLCSYGSRSPSAACNRRKSAG